MTVTHTFNGIGLYVATVAVTDALDEPAVAAE